MQEVSSFDQKRTPEMGVGQGAWFNPRVSLNNHYINFTPLTVILQ